MKKSITILLVLLTLCSCSLEPRMSQLRFKNTTPQKLVVAFKNGGEEHLVNVDGFELKETEYFIEETTGIEVRAENGKPDHAYIMKGHGTVTIYDNPAIPYTVKCLLPADAFIGGDSLYLIYQSRYEDKKVEVKADLVRTVLSHDVPRLSAPTLNGYPVAIRQEGSQIIIY